MDQKNASYHAIWSAISQHQQITICTHINPDGDTIATALALKELIKINLPSQTVKISGAKYPRFLQFLPAANDVDDQFFNNSLKIVVDTSTIKRIYDQRVITTQAIKIDHHHHENKWLLEIGGDHWPAAGEVIYEMIKALDLKVNDVVKQMLFIAIWTDTEGMTQRNISDQTRAAMASFDIDKNMLLQKMALTAAEQALVDQAKIKVHGHVSLALTDQKIPNDIYRQYVTNVYNQTTTPIVLVGTQIKPNHYRFGLRSKGKNDVSQYAKKMGGGGHYASAGFEIKDASDMTKQITKLIKEINANITK